MTYEYSIKYYMIIIHLLIKRMTIYNSKLMVSNNGDLSMRLVYITKNKNIQER